MASKAVDTPASDVDRQSELADAVDRCSTEDREAQRQLYEMLHCQIYGLMVRMVGVQDAADVMQQVFLQLFRKIDNYAGHSQFNTWLYRLATNEALQHLRKAKRWRFQHLAREPVSRNTSMTERHEQKELLDEALARLDPDLRSLFVLREVEGLSYTEIAEAMDIPEGTVGSRLNRARRKLQQHLTDLGWTP